MRYVTNHDSVPIGSAPEAEADGRGTEPSEILLGAIRTVTEQGSFGIQLSLRVIT